MSTIKLFAYEHRVFSRRGDVYIKCEAFVSNFEIVGAKRRRSEIRVSEANVSFLLYVFKIGAKLQLRWSAQGAKRLSTTELFAKDTENLL